MCSTTISMTDYRILASTGSSTVILGTMDHAMAIIIVQNRRVAYDGIADVLADEYTVVTDNHPYRSMRSDTYHLRVISPCTDAHVRKYGRRVYVSETYEEYVNDLDGRLTGMDVDEDRKRSGMDRDEERLDGDEKRSGMDRDEDRLNEDGQDKQSDERKSGLSIHWIERIRRMVGMKDCTGTETCINNDSNGINSGSTSGSNDSTSDTVRETVVYSDSAIIIVNDYKWDGQCTDQLYWLVIFRRRDLHTIREVSVNDCVHARQAVLAMLHRMYGMSVHDVLMYFHYRPSYYALHMHVVSVQREVDAGMCVGRGVLVDDVIDNLRMDGMYYRKKTMHFVD